MGDAGVLRLRSYWGKTGPMCIGRIAASRRVTMLRASSVRMRCLREGYASVTHWLVSLFGPCLIDGQTLTTRSCGITF